MYLSCAIVIVALLAWDAFRRYLLAKNPPVPPKALEDLQGITTEAVSLLNEYGGRLQKVEKWINGEEARRSIGRARAR